MRKTVILVITMIAAAWGIARAEQPSTADLAKELATRLGGDDAGALAAPMPDDPSRFIAALHIPGAQLLIISATYSAPPLLRELIVNNDHHQVYLVLNGASDRKGRLFVEDLRVDGLHPDCEPNQPFDITWRDGVTRTLYNGNWKEQKLSEADYRARFERDASDYRRILEVLLSVSAASTTSDAW